MHSRQGTKSSSGRKVRANSDTIHLSGPHSSDIQGLVYGIPGKGTTVLGTVEALLPHRGDQAIINRQSRARIMVIVNTEDNHSAAV